MHDISAPKIEEVPTGKILDYIQENLVNSHHHLGFRGQRSASWELKPTLARFLEKLKERKKVDASASYETIEGKMKEEFKKNLLLNQDLTLEQSQNIDLWQYGQHFGLPTPLLDWTYSPYVGLFFSLTGDPVIDESGEKHPRSIWVLDLDLLKHINALIKHEVQPGKEKVIKSATLLNRIAPKMEVVGEIDGFNRRIGYQQGFFTKHVFYESFEVWSQQIAKDIPHECWDVPLLQKITFSPSEEEKSKLLTTLDKMNINSRTLFPDIAGSIAQTCFALEHDNRPKTLSFSGTTRKFDDKAS